MLCATGVPQVKPVRPESPKLLPLVHQLWPALLGALRDARTPLVVERGLQLLAQATRAAGGQFMARRVKQVRAALLPPARPAGCRGLRSPCCAARAPQLQPQLRHPAPPL